VEGNTDTTAYRQAERLARLIWILAFVVPLLLSMLLLGVKSAQASPGPAVVPLAFEEELEFEEEAEGEFAGEECEIAEEEAAEGELSKAEADEICAEAKGETGAASSAGECPIHSAIAHASTHHGRLKLTLGYTTNDPIKATIQLRSGPTELGTFKRHLGKSGVLRITKKMGNAHGRIVVHIQLPPAERAGCPSRRLVLFPR
jgi:hypothetical protein